MQVPHRQTLLVHVLATRPVARAVSLFVILCAALGFTLMSAQPAQAQTAGCVGGACVSSGTHLISDFDSRQSELLDAVLGGLLDTEIDLEAPDYNGLAGANVEMGALLDQLALDLGVGTPEEALTSDITLNELFLALDAITADSTASTALGNLSTSVALIPTIQLGDLLHIQSGAEDGFSDLELNLLELVTGSAQLFNFQHVLTTPAPITIRGDALGLEGILDEVSLQIQVTEPPTIICGPAGTRFYSAAMRVALNLDLVDVNLGGTSGLVSANVTLGQLAVYADVARGSGVIQAIDAIANSVEIEATPGLTDLYVGSIRDDVFFDRTHTLSPSDVTTGTVGSVGVNLPLATSVTASISISSAAQTAGSPQTLSFTGPYPETQITGTTTITNLVSSLVNNLDIETTLEAELLGLGPVLDTILMGLGIDLDELLTNILLPLIKGLVGNLFNSILNPLLGDLVDPLLAGVGIGLGEMDVTVLGVTQLCPALDVTKTHTSNFSAGSNGVYTIRITNTGSLTTSTPTTVVDTLPAGFSYVSHSGTGWTLAATTGNQVTLANATPLPPATALDPLHLIVAVNDTVSGTVTNRVAVTTTGNTSSGIAEDPTTVIDPDPDNDDDGVPDIGDSEPDNPCVPNPNAGPCDQDDDGLTNDEEKNDSHTNPTDPDTDNDGVEDGEEVENGTNPLDPCDPNPNHPTCTSDDPDGDGIPSDQEDDNSDGDGNPATNPTDTDGDGTPDFLDPDDDGDGIPTAKEDEDLDGDGNPATNPTDTDGDGVPNYLDPDDDGDGIPTREEDANLDGDGDPSTNPTDSDGDGIPDYLDPQVDDLNYLPIINE